MTLSTTFRLGLATLVCALGAAQAANAKLGAPVTHHSHATIQRVMDEPRTEAPFNQRALSLMQAAALVQLHNRP